MQRKIGYFIIFVALCTGGLSSLAYGLSPSQTHLPINTTLPKASLDFGNLDVRDNLNRPVKSVAAKKSMERLFTESLNHLLMFNLTPSKQAMWALMSKSLNGFVGWITKVFKSKTEQITAWFSSKKWKKLIFSWNLLKAKWGEEKEDHHFVNNPRNSFQFLVGNIISSTQLLR